MARLVTYYDWVVTYTTKIMATNKLILTKKIVERMTANYGVVTTDQVGEGRKIHVVSQMSSAFNVENKDGDTVMEYGNTGAILQKKLINFKAISMEGHKANLAILREAVELEEDGDAEGASALYQKYLNAARFSCSVLSTEPAFNLDLSDGDEVTIRVESYTNDAGSIFLRGNGRSLKVKEATAAPMFKGSIFDSITAIADDTQDTPEETPEQVISRVRAEKKAAKATTKA